MTESDKKAFLAIMYKLGAVYDMPFDNKHLISAWFEALSDYDVAEVASAVQRYIKSADFGSYKPKPADLIKMIEGTSADKSFLAWTKVEQALRRVGTYVTVVFDDPIIHRVISDMGGWMHLGQTAEKELPFVAKEFAGRYRGFSQRQQVPNHPTKLYGLIDATNGANGYAEEMQPVLIGDGDKAKLVLEGGRNAQNEIEKLTGGDFLSLPN